MNKGENSGQSKDQQQSDPNRKGPSADVNMVFMLPMEFLAPSSDDELDFPDQIAQLALDPMTAIFEKPADDERQHLKALFVKGRVDGQPMTKILIDGGLPSIPCHMRCIGNLEKEIRISPRLI